MLEDRGSFHIIYSSRMFPTKTTAIWRALDDFEHAQLINAYFAVAGGWEQPRVLDISPHHKGSSDSVYVVLGPRWPSEASDFLVIPRL